MGRREKADRIMGGGCAAGPPPLPREGDVSVRPKARPPADLRALRVDINGCEVPPDAFSLLKHDGEGFSYVQFPLRVGLLRDGDNEIGFALREGARVPCSRVMVQEVEVRVVPISHAG